MKNFSQQPDWLITNRQEDAEHAKKLQERKKQEQWNKLTPLQKQARKNQEEINKEKDLATSEIPESTLTEMREEVKMQAKLEESLRRVGYGNASQPEVSVEPETQSETQTETQVEAQPEAQSEKEAGPEVLLENMKNDLSDAFKRLEEHRNDAYNWYCDASFADVFFNRATYGKAMQPVYEARHQIDAINKEFMEKFGSLSDAEKTEAMLKIERMLDNYYNPADRQPKEAKNFDELFEIILSGKEPIPRDGGGQMRRKHCVKMIKKFRDGKISAVVFPTHDGIRDAVLRLANYQEAPVATPKTEIPEVSIEQQAQRSSIYGEKLYITKNINESLRAGNQFKTGNVVIVNEGAVPGASKAEWTITEYSGNQMKLRREDEAGEHLIVMDLNHLKEPKIIVAPEASPETESMSTDENNEQEKITEERLKWKGRLNEVVMDTQDLTEVMFNYFEKMPAIVRESNFMSKYYNMLIEFGSVEGIRFEDKDFKTVEEAQVYYEKNVRDEIQKILENSVSKLEKLVRAVYSKKRPVHQGEELLKQKFELGVVEIEEYLAKFRDMGINVELDNGKLEKYRLG